LTTVGTDAEHKMTVAI